LTTGRKNESYSIRQKTPGPLVSESQKTSRGGSRYICLKTKKEDSKDQRIRGTEEQRIKRFEDKKR
jgi:hypothetical protein